jgi:hypothetical protein
MSKRAWNAGDVAIIVACLATITIWILLAFGDRR